MFLDDIVGPLNIEEARMSAQLKLQRAFQREQEKSEASRRRGEEVMAQARADAEKKAKEQDVKEAGNPAQQAAIAIAKKKEQGVDENVVVPPAVPVKPRGDYKISPERQKEMDRDVKLLKKYREKGLSVGSAVDRFTKFKQKHTEEQGVAEGSEPEGSTFKNSLHTIIRVATHLEKQMADSENFPEWESEMIGSVKDQMVKIMDYEISKKEQQGVAEVYTPSPAKPFRNPKGFNKQGTGVGNKLADLNRKEWEEKKKKEQGVAEGDREFRNQERNAGIEAEDHGTYSIWTQGSKDSKPKCIVTKQCSMDDAERHARSIKKKYPFLKVWMQAHHLGKAGFFPMNEDSWSDGQGQWSSQHDQWTKESVEDSSEAVYGAILRRIIGAHKSLLGTYGPDRVMAAARDVADWNNDAEEIGSSDVSGWVRQVFQKLQNNEY